MENVLTSPASLEHPASRAQLWTGRVLTGLIATFLLLDALGKLMLLAPVVLGSQKVGLALDCIRPIGVVLAGSMLLHVLPRTQLVAARSRNRRSVLVRSLAAPQDTCPGRTRAGGAPLLPAVTREARIQADRRATKELLHAALRCTRATCPD